MRASIKPRIIKLFKYNVWKVSVGNRPPQYLFNFQAACHIAKLWTEDGLFL